MNAATGTNILSVEDAISTVREQLGARDALIAQLQEELRTANDSAATAAMLRAAGEERAQALAAQARDAEIQRREAEESAKRATAERDSARKVIAKLEQEVQDVRSERDIVMSASAVQAREAAAQQAQLQRQFEVARAAEQLARDELSGAKDKIAAAERSAQAALRSSHDADARVADATRQAAEAQRTAQVTEQRCTALTVELAAARTEIKRLEGDRDALAATRETQRGEVEAAKRAAADARAQYEAADQKVRAIEASNARLSKEIAVMQEAAMHGEPGNVVSFAIINATYGSDTKRVDVTKKLRESVAFHVSVRSCNEIFGDAVPGVLKYLQVRHAQYHSGVSHCAVTRVVRACVQFEYKLHIGGGGHGPVKQSPKVYEAGGKPSDGGAVGELVLCDSLRRVRSPGAEVGAAAASFLSSLF